MESLLVQGFSPIHLYTLFKTRANPNNNHLNTNNLTLEKMKKILIIAFIFIHTICLSQEYNIDQLKIISQIWGECYLFHPSVIRSDKNIEWEKQLVQFLPHIKNEMTNDEFINVINSELLSKLQDPFTLVQSFNKNKSVENSNFQSNETFEYIKITENQLSDISSLTNIDKTITDRISKKPLVIDLR